MLDGFFRLRGNDFHRQVTDIDGIVGTFAFGGQAPGLLFE